MPILANTSFHAKPLHIVFFLLAQLTFGHAINLYAFQIPLRSKPLLNTSAKFNVGDTTIKKSPNVLKKNFKAATTQL